MRCVHGSGSSGSRSPAPAAASNGWSSRTPVIGGSTRCDTASAALISPATPAAALVCPMLALMLPRAATGALNPRTASNASSSTWSPTAVPVPWPSIRPAAAGSRPARA
ncbi:hypothetical protein BBK82_30810 [Lentzea guizhouensis]|uniref:Uncharacterized protein n=1 Tax=Lentzea guizhouensis TaxID=1586287 RepID=A0A1B2HPY6_9PSEU|nr:hypothetical protein BBK82_30810 [Lentzea guizhouensis]